MKFVPRVHNYALKIPWAWTEAQLDLGPQCGSTAAGSVYLYFFSFFDDFPPPKAFSDKPAHRTHRRTDTPRKLGAWTYKGTPGWSLLMIVIPVLDTRTQLALGCGMLNSLILLLHYVYIYALTY